MRGKLNLTADSLSQLHQIFVICKVRKMHILLRMSIIKYLLLFNFRHGEAIMATYILSQYR